MKTVHTNKELIERLNYNVNLEESYKILSTCFIQSTNIVLGTTNALIVKYHNYGTPLRVSCADPVSVCGLARPPCVWSQFF